MKSAARPRDPWPLAPWPALPAQIFEPCVEDTGERRLVRAVLADAVRLVLRDGSDTPRGWRRRADAMAWIRSDGDGVMSFRWACDGLAIDPQWLRGLIRCGSEVPVTQRRTWVR